MLRCVESVQSGVDPSGVDWRQVKNLADNVGLTTPARSSPGCSAEKTQYRAHWFLTVYRPSVLALARLSFQYVQLS